jgi:hypothetical protein
MVLVSATFPAPSQSGQDLPKLLQGLSPVASALDLHQYNHPGSLSNPPNQQKIRPLNGFFSQVRFQVIDQKSLTRLRADGKATTGTRNSERADRMAKGVVNAI